YNGQRLEKLLLPPATRFQLAYLERLREISWKAGQIQGLHLVSVDAHDPSLVQLRFKEVTVILGRLDPGASERLARLIPLTPKIHELKTGIEAVDLRWEQQVTFHVKKDAQGLSPVEQPEE